ncbi:hypothetical protein SGLAM104S_04139 [Streptomyces glaucescens]
MATPRGPRGQYTAGRARRPSDTLEAALLRFGQDGYRKTSLARIARDAEITDAGLLHHFRDKQQLLLAVVEYWHERMDVRWERVWSPCGTPSAATSRTPPRPSPTADVRAHGRRRALPRPRRRGPRPFLARFHTGGGHLAEETQTAYALALCFRLIRDDTERAEAGHRLADLVAARGHRIGTGFLRTRWCATPLRQTPGTWTPPTGC